MSEVGAIEEGELAGALELRHRVFCDEQGVHPAAERDGLDDQAVHLVAREGEAVLGTCRVLLDGPDARLGRLCVDPAARGRGLATQLLAEAEGLARAAGAARMHLHAQTAALSLYERAGYAPVGAPFDEEGIEHLAMDKPLA
jgi:ElaA protein